MMRQGNSGFTIVEVMAAVLTLVILILGAAAVMYQTGGGIQVAGNKRVAMDLVNSVLEDATDTAYNNLGNAYYNIAKKQEAIASYKKAIRLNPAYTEAYYNVSVVYFREKQFKKHLPTKSSV